jgi:hypothetical protein
MTRQNFGLRGRAAQARGERGVSPHVLRRIRHHVLRAAPTCAVQVRSATPTSTTQILP